MSDKTRIIHPVDRQIVHELIDLRLRLIAEDLEALWRGQRFDEPLAPPDMINIIRANIGRRT